MPRKKTICVRIIQKKICVDLISYRVNTNLLLQMKDFQRLLQSIMIENFIMYVYIHINIKV